MRCILLALAALGWCLPGAARAASFGTSSALLLNDPMAVRPLALGGAYAAMADDAASINTNPAGLASLRGVEFSGSHGFDAFDTQQEYLDGAADLGFWGTLGLQAGYLHEQDTARDIWGNVTGSFQNSNLLLGLAWARGLAPGWNLGLGLKYLGESYDSLQITTLAGDLGLQAPLPFGLRAGLSALNLGASQDSQGNSLAGPPSQLNAGLSLPLLDNLVTAEVELQSLPTFSELRVVGAAELALPVRGEDHQLEAQLDLRAGFRSGLVQPDEPQQPSFGAGFELPPTYSLDYAAILSSALGTTQRFSLSIHFGANRAQAAPLDAPSHLAIERQGSDWLLSWRDGDRGLEGFDLYARSGSEEKKLNSSPIPTAHQRLHLKEDGREIRFFVRAVATDGRRSPPSEALIFTGSKP